MSIGILFNNYYFNVLLNELLIVDAFATTIQINNNKSYSLYKYNGRHNMSIGILFTRVLLQCKYYKFLNALLIVACEYNNTNKQYHTLQRVYCGGAPCTVVRSR